jgi:hypothetical protein
MERVALEVDATTVTAEALGLAGEIDRDAEEDQGERLLEALRRTKWNITQTAALLRVSRKTVRARIQRYGLRPAEESAPSTPTAASPSPWLRGTGVTPRDVPSSGRGSEVRIYTLGRFEIFAGDRPIREDSLPGVPARSLKRLVTQAWPQAPEPVPSLRQALVEAGLEPMSDQPDRSIWIDAQAFDQIVAEARHAADPLALLRDANALYVGEYLPDDIHEDWSVARREALRHTWIELQLMLARVCEQGRA